MKKRIYFIEGNISGGKSTLGRGLEQEGYSVYQEPVDEWIEEYKEESGENILEKFYRDRERYAFQFEVLVMMTRWEKIKKALASGQNTLIIERCLDIDENVFAKGLYLEGSKTSLDWKIYKLFTKMFKDEISHYFEDVEVEYIYLVTTPEECHSRIPKRGRDEESSIPLEYLERVHHLHEEWMNNVEKKNVVHRIDGHSLPEVIQKNVIDIISKHD